MPVIRWERWNVSRSDTYTIIPIGDVHLGHVACDERLLAATVKRIAEDPTCYWVGLGDYCEYVNRSDKRYDPEQCADWVRAEPRGRIAQVQTEHITQALKPIADRCLGLVEGNHERIVQQKYEWDPFYEIVKALKKEAGLGADQRLGLGFTGWLDLRYYQAPEPKRAGLRRVLINLHHGFVGGRLAGAKALNMQRRLWTTGCDLCLMGHSHNTDVFRQSVAELDRGGRKVYPVRKGAFCGTFLGAPVDTVPYYEEQGYFPTPVGTIEIELRPGAHCVMERVRITA